MAHFMACSPERHSEGPRPWWWGTLSPGERGRSFPAAPCGASVTEKPHSARNDMAGVAGL